MVTLKKFETWKIESMDMVFGGRLASDGTYGSGACNTACDDNGQTDCTSYTYTDDCNGDNRQITSSVTVDGNCP